MPISAPDSLLAFKPRSVFSSAMAVKEEKNLKDRLLPAIARFLERHGLKKTLRKLRAEAQLEEVDVTAVLLDLEEMYCKYSEICSSSTMTSNKNKNQGEETVISAGAEAASKKKKKKSEDVSTQATLCEVNGKPNKAESDALNDLYQDSKKMEVKREKAESSEENLKNHPEERSMDALIVSDTEKGAKRDKKKKKNKPSDSLADNAEQNGIVVNQDAGVLKADEGKGKTGEKKRKKNKNNDSSACEDPRADDSCVNNNLESKGSKKRKRRDSEENQSEACTTLNDLGVENNHANEEGEKENGVLDVDTQKATAEKRSAHANGGQEENGKGSALQNSEKRRRIGSAEPKKPFQRVNVDEVKILDERLKDNSYWAKAGAESGYGAKAQEILGQVKGKGFRHEKTKKKRGSYRGGQIDLDSHSVKFNYSDEE